MSIINLMRVGVRYGQLMMAATMASHFVLSRMIPATPNIKAAGIENITNSPPRAAIMLPQPGLQTSSIRNVTADTASNFADILPKYTFKLLRTGQDTSFNN